MINKYINKLTQKIADQISVSYPHNTQIEIVHSLFSYIGIARLRELLDESEKNGDKYVCLAELFSRVQRNNLAKENNDIIHSYYELLPRLNAYSEAFNHVIKK